MIDPYDLDPRDADALDPDRAYIPQELIDAAKDADDTEGGTGIFAGYVIAPALFAHAHRLKHGDE